MDGGKDSCHECGSTDLRVQISDGVAVQECGLCGALGGDPTAVRKVLDARRAREHGIDPIVWPLHRFLSGLPGLRVQDADAGEPASGRMPSVRWQATDSRGLLQLENIVKSLHLAARSLHLPWCVAVEFDRGLLFALRPRNTPTGIEFVSLARADLEQLHRCLDRDLRLSWWQR